MCLQSVDRPTISNSEMLKKQNKQQTTSQCEAHQNQTKQTSQKELKIYIATRVNDYKSNDVFFKFTHYFKQIVHCRQRAPVENVPSASGTSHLGMIDIQTKTKSKYYDHIVLLYLESRRCRYRSIIFACFYLYVSVVNFIDYSDMDKMMDINNDKC